MPDILHNGRARWSEAPADMRDLTTFLDWLAAFYAPAAASDTPVYGVSLWQDLIRSLAADDLPTRLSDDPDSPRVIVAQFRADLLDARVAASQGAGSGSRPRSKTVFVSHRQSDKQRSIDLANEIIAAGANAWLDVWNPVLPRLQAAPIPQKVKDLLMALVIEMGLINADGLTALLTVKAAGSAWIPYEYGRVRNRGLFIQKSAICVRGTSVTHEGYMSLGPRFDYNGSHYPGLAAWVRSL